MRTNHQKNWSARFVMACVVAALLGCQSAPPAAPDARTLSSMGVERVIVEGHTDNVGSAKLNEALSPRRAESVAQQSTQAGLKHSGIECRVLGFDKPIADNATAEGRAQHRRVVVTVRVD